MTTQPRTPAGSPEGGQFAETTGAESNGMLPSDPATNESKVITRDDPLWPKALLDLGVYFGQGPLFVRGNAELLARWDDAVVMDGSRASTAYGEHVAAQFAAELAERDVPVITGGSYGIGAAAIRGGLTATKKAPQIVFLAGGLDRVYPAGNAALLEQVLTNGGLHVSATPDGSAPTKERFQDRSRYMATAGSTLIVEAATRSGAIITATTAAQLGRPVWAVPGPITSVTSHGANELIRNGVARAVTTPRDVDPNDAAR